MFWTTIRYGPQGIPVIGLHGELDTTSDPLPLVSPRMIIDLEKLEFCDCAGIRMLVRARKQCDRLGGWLILASPRGAVLRLLTVLQMDTQFVIWEDSPW